MENQRVEIFASLKDKIVIVSKNLELKWCSDIRLLKDKAVNIYESENNLSLDFGEIEVFGNIKLQFGTNSGDNYKFTRIIGTFAQYKEAKILTNKLIDILGRPDEFTDVQEHLFAYWTANNIVIQVCQRDHHGGPWYEYSISKKNCT